MQNLYFFWLHMLLFMCFCVDPLNGLNATAAKANVGVILDLNTSLGKICRTCISLAIEDFYSNRSHATMIEPRFRDSRSGVVDAASAAIDLLKNTQVVAILGPQNSNQADFVIDIGEKVKVPIISPAASPTLLPQESPYFIRSAWSSSCQAKAIAAIVNKFGWREVVFVYDDTNYGSRVALYLTVNLLESNAFLSYQSVISSVATDDQIRVELHKLMRMQTRVFFVHMLPNLASRFFKLAKEAGMMDKGYAWIIGDVLTSLLDSMDSETMEAMEGVLGVRAYIPRSQELRRFAKRWSKRFHEENPDMDRTELNVFGLWAYDSITSLAEAIERVGVTSPRFMRLVDGGNSTDLEAIGTSSTGPLLVPLIRNHMSKGLSGDFNISNGQVQPSAFEIVNVHSEKEISVGFWTEQCGLVKPEDRQAICSGKEENLDLIVWPGKTIDDPKGWEFPTSGKVLRVGVPAKGGFNEFIKVERVNNETDAVKATGFAIDVFEEVWNNTPYAFQVNYFSFAATRSEGDYDELVEQLDLKKFDAVVGDVTITVNRTEWADFTIPYTETGVAMVVPIEPDERKNAWIFMKPLTGGLWLTIGAFFVFTGIVVWVLEHRINVEFQGPRHKQVGMIFWFAFSTLVFAHKEKVSSNLTRFVLIVWVFVVLVLTSSYTANLTSMLTVEQLQPRFKDIADLLKSGKYVGYQKGSFVGGFLTNMRFEKSRLISYSTLEEYDEALSNSSIGAFFDEIPYIRLFLSNSKNSDKYTMVGPTYPTSGLGFAFPKGSPLVADVSREIVKLKASEAMETITEKWLGEASNGTRIASQKSLDVDSFKGLFLIAGSSSTIALAIFFSKFLHENWHILTSTDSLKEKLWALARVFASEVGKSLSLSSTRSRSRVHDRGGGVGRISATSPHMSIPSEDEEDMFSQGQGFVMVEIPPRKPAFQQPQEANS